MKALLVNGSPRPQGNTAAALEIIAAELQKGGIETANLQIGGVPLKGCSACMGCRKIEPAGETVCVIKDDPFNDWLELALQADAIILGSPVYFANITTEMKAFIDRLGFICRLRGNSLRRKVGAGVVVARRGGAQNAYNALMAFFGIMEMVVPCADYWNIGFALQPGELQNDAEGCNTFRLLGENTAWVTQKLNA